MTDPIGAVAANIRRLRLSLSELSRQSSVAKATLAQLELGRGRYDSPAHGNGVREHLIVYQGELTAGPRDSAVTLAGGDFLSFSADRPHLYESRTAVTRATLLLWYPPTPAQ